MDSCAAIATSRRGSIPARTPSLTKVVPWPASGLPAAVRIASMPAASVGATQRSAESGAPPTAPDGVTAALAASVTAPLAPSIVAEAASRRRLRRIGGEVNRIWGLYA